MKKCRYCGTPQSDERHTCVDCGRPLPKPLSAEEAEAIEDALDDRLDAMSDRTDAFYVSRTDQILGIIGIVPAVSQETIVQLAGAVINLLVLLGIVVDPTTDGIGDSDRARGYESPYRD